ncbi:hypothetical protein CCACVL1_09551 [Corchorus capsularis]|uniref:Uncharacterized protein n=1 Tax=Corchorus capsularis TaxID=210143 RepID=A0A1R3IVF7_COCAP|nr:hypothetical protein CCACVL1_09551 [Corchorus capsularis]
MREMMEFRESDIDDLVKVREGVEWEEEEGEKNKGVESFVYFRKVKAREVDKVGGEANLGDIHNEGELNLFETKTTMKKRDIVV